MRGCGRGDAKHGPERSIALHDLGPTEAHSANTLQGIPTTRAACIVTSSTQIERDLFYTGHPQLEAASMVLRLAPTFMRFGSFEIFKSREESNTERTGPSVAHPLLLPKMLDFVIFHHFPALWAAAGGGATSADAPDDKRGMYVAFFEEVVSRTATLVAGWQSVGFCHGARRP